MWVSTVRSDKNSRAGDLPVAQPVRDEPGDLQLPPGQHGVRPGLGRLGRLRRRFACDGERDTFVDRHRLAALAGPSNAVWPSPRTAADTDRACWAWYSCSKGEGAFVAETPGAAQEAGGPLMPA